MVLLFLAKPVIDEEPKKVKFKFLRALLILVSIPKTYAEAGVDTKAVKMARKGLMEWVKKTWEVSGTPPIKHPYHNLIPLSEEEFLVCSVDGIGTKQLIGVVMNHNEGISYDVYSMVTDDLVRTGAKVITLGQYIACEGNLKEELGEQLGKGLYEAAKKAKVPVTFGETSSVKDVINSLENSIPEDLREKPYTVELFKKIGKVQNYDIAFAGVGVVSKHELISCKDVKVGDELVGYKSSGGHLNGYTWFRKSLLKLWGGKYDFWEIPDGLEKEIGMELLTPKEMYYPAIRETNRECEVKAFHHNTGDSLRKMESIMEESNVGFLIDDPFVPQPIFQLTYEVARPELEELYGYLNMGFGGISIVQKEDVETAVRIAKKHGIEAQRVGTVIREKRLIVKTPNSKEFPAWLRNKRINLIG